MTLLKCMSPFLSSCDAKDYDLFVRYSDVGKVTAFHRSIIPSVEFDLISGKVGERGREARKGGREGAETMY